MSGFLNLIQYKIIAVLIIAVITISCDSNEASETEQANNFETNAIKPSPKIHAIGDGDWVVVTQTD